MIKVTLFLALLSVIAYFWAYPEKLLHLAAWFLARVMYRVKVMGLENIPKKGPAILICNHVAFNDWLVVGGCMPRPVRFVMYKGMFNLPVVKTICARGKVIPIAPAHEDPELMELAFKRIAQELRAGHLVCIYPEGKITKTGELNPFKAGISRMLADTPVPVVPMALHGLWGSFFSRKGGPAMKKLPRRFRANVQLKVSEPIAPEAASPKALEDKVRAMLQEMS